MVSTKTQIAGFEFDNCLMNAAGVACMTVEELEGVKNSAAGTFVTKNSNLGISSGKSRTTLSRCSTRFYQLYGATNNGLELLLKLSFRVTRKGTEPYLLFIISWNVSRGNSYHFEKGSRE